MQPTQTDERTLVSRMNGAVIIVESYESQPPLMVQGTITSASELNGWVNIAFVVRSKAEGTLASMYNVQWEDHASDAGTSFNLTAAVQVGNVLNGKTARGAAVLIKLLP